jgi:pilus assembly protein CpaF
MALSKRPVFGENEEPQRQVAPPQQRPVQPSQQPQQPAQPQYEVYDFGNPQVEETYQDETEYVEIETVEPVQENIYLEEINIEPGYSNNTQSYEEDTYDEDEENEEIDDADIADEYESFSPEDVNSARDLLALLNDSTSSEVIMNGPATILYKRDGARVHAKDIKFSSVEAYHQFIDDVILEYTDTSDRIRSKNGEDKYLIEGQLNLPDWENEDEPPLLARVHIIAPPVVPEAKVTIAKKSRRQLTIDRIVQSGSLSPQMGEFLKVLIKGRVTTVFSGLSGSGKTTLLEALSYNFDPNDRIIVVEDTPELRFPITDVVYLHSTSSKPGQDASKVVSLEWLVQSTNRMRPDRIVIGEVRGAEMSEFLIAANSGADGSMTTMHASSPKLTLDKMISLAMKSATSKSEISVARDIASTVQIIIQMSLIEGRHIITQIEEVTRTVRKETGGIVTSTLFEYDRNKNVFQPVQRPSQDLMSYLQQRGVEVDLSWFRGIV